MLLEILFFMEGPRKTSLHFTPTSVYLFKTFIYQFSTKEVYVYKSIIKQLLQYIKNHSPNS